jgi:hypothetical protein
MTTSQKKSFVERESACEMLFLQLGQCYHLYTPENYELIFSSEDDLKAGMTILAVCALLSPGIRILTFQLMSNHIHVTLVGDLASCLAFFITFKHRLRLYLKGTGRPVDLEEWDAKIREIKDLRDLRTVIVYTNRNGFVVSQNDTPFSYRWGANRFFFNPDAFRIHFQSREKLTVRQIRRLMHSADFDRAAGMTTVDGYVSPPGFCDVKTGSALFRDAHHYFQMVSRDIESQRQIAKELGESVFYSDNELFNAVMLFIHDKYGKIPPSALPKESKIETALWMHHNYNAGNKQISRILRIDLSVVNALFPSGC